MLPHMEGIGNTVRDIGCTEIALLTAACCFFVLGVNAHVEFAQWHTIGLIPICACRLAGRER